MSSIATPQQNVRDWEVTERRYLEALAVANNAQGDQRLSRYRLSLALAELYKARHRYGDAEKYFRSARDVADNLFGAQRPETARPTNWVGEMCLEQGRLREAEISFHQALKFFESNGSEDNEDKMSRAGVLNNMAVVQHMNHNLSRAEKVMREVIKVFETAPDHKQDFGTALSNLAVIQQEAGHSAEALTTAEKAASILQQGNDPEGLAVSLVNLGGLRLAHDDLVGAEDTLRRALKITEQTGEEDSPARAALFSHLGVLYARTDRAREADPYFQRGIDINRRLRGPEHPKLLNAMEAYAAFLRTTKRKSEAKKLEAYVREKRENYAQRNPAEANVVDVRSLIKQNHH